tara:strand:+ start:351 stop:557 length:207 start_codon:yes stop_codon:yes gene_type:complete
MSYGKEKEKKPVQQVVEKKPTKGVAIKDEKKKTPEISSYADIGKVKMVLRKKKKKKEDGDNTSESGLV